MTDKQTFTFTQKIDAPIKVVYEACTNLSVLQMWLCDVADVDARENGRFYIWWNEGYYAVGKYTEVKEHGFISFTWHGSEEPGPSAVNISLEGKDSGTLVTLTHSDLGTGDAWEKAIAPLKENWPIVLTNLQWIVEKGVDKRVYGRPFMGILINGLVDEDVAKQLGVPEVKGVWITGAADNTGAAESDLQENDVIHKVGEIDIVDFNSFGPALAPFGPDDTVDLGVYRGGGEKLTIPVRLSKRPLPVTEPTAEELAERVHGEYEKIDKEIDEIFDGVTEEEAAKRPAPEEWNAKETLAHILYSEQWMQMMFTMRIGGNRGIDFHNDLAIITGIAGGFDTTADLRETLKQAEKVTVSMLANFEDDFIARKYFYNWAANGAIEGFPGHTRSHYDQLKNAIKAAKKG